MHAFTPHAVAASLALLGTASAQQGSISHIRGNTFIDAEARVAAATGASFTGMLGVSVDTAGHYYVSARRDMTGNPHGLFEFDANGAFVANYNQPAGTAVSAWGIRDLALDETTNVIYGGLEGDTIYAFDATTKTWDASKDVTVTGAMVGGTIRALALDSSSGTFYTVNFGSVIQRIDLATGAADPNTLPSVTTGAYGAAIRTEAGVPAALMINSQTGSVTGPTAPGKGVNMIEVDLTTGLETGNYFYGDHVLPGSAGGAARHTLGGEQVLVSLSQAASDGFFAMRVADVYGQGCGGNIDYAGGQAYAGNPTFAIVGSNLSTPSAFLMVSIGEMQTSIPGVIACPIEITFPVADAVGGPVTAGTATWGLPIPPGALGNVYFQIVEFGGALPLNLTDALKLAIQP